jgi:8-oxo-dGTP pyrophosphatase MutT (NUDIX family)
MKVDVEFVRAALRDRAHHPASLKGDERFAAVAAILRQQDDRHDTEVLLIRRAEQAGDPWSGHMAFPGGRQDPSDRDLLHTAVRETEEEVGLVLGANDSLGRLDDLHALARGRRVGLVIAPHVFALQGDPALSLNPAEVRESVWAPLAPLMSGARDTTFSYEYEGSRFSLPAYDVNGHIVWGLTHRMLGVLFEALDGKRRALPPASTP